MSPGLDWGAKGRPPLDPAGPSRIRSAASPAGIRLGPAPNGCGGGRPRSGQDAEAGDPLPAPPQGRGGPRADGERRREGTERRPRGSREPRPVPRAPREPSRGLSPFGKYNKRKEAGRQRGGRRGARAPEPGPPRRRRGTGGARREGAPSRGPARPLLAPAARPAPTFEVRDDPVQLRVDRGVGHGGWRAARRAEGGGEEAPRRPGPCARAPAEQSWPPEPLGPRARLNEWGRRAGAGARLPAPPPRPAPAARADQVPAPGPASPARTGCSARPSRPGPGGGGGGCWGPRRRRRRRGDRPSPGRPIRRPAPPRLARAPGRRPTRLGPSPPDAPPRPDVGGCGGRAAARGRCRVRGERFLPFPGALGSSGGRFYLRSQTKFTAAAAACARSAPARVKRPSWRAAGPPPVGPEPRSEGRAPESRGLGAGVAPLQRLPPPPPVYPRGPLLHL